MNRLNGRQRVLRHAADAGYVEEWHDPVRVTLVRGTYRVWVKFSTAGAVVSATGNHGPWVLGGPAGERPSRVAESLIGLLR